MLTILIVNINVSELKPTVLWLESSMENRLLSRRILFIVLYKTMLGSFIYLYPGGGLK